MATLIDSIDERTKLAGTNHLEVLLFSLGTNDETGRNELFGINVFKVREVLNIPEITSAPEMPDGIEGFVSLRGDMVPIINLQKFCNLHSQEKPKILMITEYNTHVQGFLVTSVDTIQRMSWQQVKEPPPLISKRLGGLVTAVAEMNDKRLVMIMDVEKVLADAGGFYDETVFEGIDKLDTAHPFKILFADDSSVARKQITQTLDKMGVKHLGVINGAEAWKTLEKMATKCEQEGCDIKSDRPSGAFCEIIWLPNKNYAFPNTNRPSRTKSIDAPYWCYQQGVSLRRGLDRNCIIKSYLNEVKVPEYC